MHTPSYHSFNTFSTRTQLFDSILHLLLWVSGAMAVVASVKYLLLGGGNEWSFIPLPLTLLLIKLFGTGVSTSIKASLVILVMLINAFFVQIYGGSLDLTLWCGLLYPVFLRFLIPHSAILAVVPLSIFIFAWLSHYAVGLNGTVLYSQDDKFIVHFPSILFAILGYYTISIMFNQVYRYTALKEMDLDNNMAQGLLDELQLEAHFNWLRHKNEEDTSVRVYGIRVAGLNVDSSSQTAPELELVSAFNNLLRSRLPIGVSIGRLKNGDYVAMAERRYWDAFETGLRSLLHDSLEIDGSYISIEPSIATSDAPTDGATLKNILINLNTVFERALEERKLFARYTLQDRERQSSRKQFSVSELLAAIDKRQLEVHFQPKIDIQNEDQLVGAEALVRWRHPELGLLYPGDFVDEMERSAVRLNFVNYIIEESAKFCYQLQEAGHPIEISFNLNAHDIQDLRVTADLHRVQSDYNFPPGLLQIEVSEHETSVSLDSLTRALNAIRELGYGVSLDDFGTGMSSLSYFQALPVDTVKIDRRFVHDLHLNPSSEQVVRMITSLAKSEGCALVAEGAEVSEEIDVLRKIGVNQVQGFYFGAALDAESFFKHYDLTIKDDDE
jgi:EAL domain-containing protein (putative c-di-GMP-specific phosphodiesterase class I)